MGDGVEHRLLGDGVEGDPFDVDALQGFLARQDVEHMPGDRLALTVRVGGEVELAALGDGLGDGVDALLRRGVDLPVHGEVLVRTHRAVLGRQVADMAVGGQHREAGPEVFPNRLGLSRRLDDQHVHGWKLAPVKH